jgi:site-specific recombinase XerD
MTNTINLEQCLKEFPEYLKGVRDASKGTTEAYLHDVDRYMDYFREKVDSSLQSFCIDAHHIRGFVTFLRSAGNENATIERRLHGLNSFWTYLYLEHGYPAPISLQACNIRLKKHRHPTPPVVQRNYIFLMERLYDELSKID